MVKAPSQLLLNRGAGILKEGSQIASTSATSSFYKKKYKSWRKGKSTKHSGIDSVGSTSNNGAKNHGSLKQQLRGLLRLQQKKMKDRDSITIMNHLDDDSDATLQQQQQEQELQEKIDALQEQIQMRTISEKERNNAKKSHKLRFIDRQRTTRLYQQYMKQLQQLSQQDITSNDNDLQRKKLHDDLFKLALDQIYIAHFPLDRTSYVSIFNPISTTTTSSADHTTPSMDDITPSQQQQQQQQHRRTVMNNRLLHKMATQRQCIIERLYKSNQSLLQDDDGDVDTQNEETNHSATNARSSDKAMKSHTKRIQPVSWIHPSQYERIQHLTTWSTQLERTTFNITIVNNTTSTNSHENRISSLELDYDTTKNTDERFHNVNSTFNRTQQLLLQEQERIERELSTIEEENSDDDEQYGSTTEARKRRNPDASTTKYINDESDSSDDYDDDNEMDDDVDPLKRSAATSVVPMVTSKRYDDTTRKTRQHNDKTTSDDNADHDHENEENDSDSSESSDSEQSDDSDSVSSSSSMKKSESKSTSTSTGQDEVLAMATNLRKLASQKEKTSFHNTNQSGSNIEEDDDFFVALDDIDNNNEDNHTSRNVNVFASAKRDAIRNNHHYNGIGDKSQGWATQKQLPGQFRKKQRRR